MLLNAPVPPTISLSSEALDEQRNRNSYRTTMTDQAVALPLYLNADHWGIASSCPIIHDRNVVISAKREHWEECPWENRSRGGLERPVIVNSGGQPAARLALCPHQPT